MSRYLEEFSNTRYTPTPSHVCDIHDYPVPISDTLLVHTHLEVYRGLTRQFAITLRTTGGDDIARIDTDHSVVHRHQFHEGGGQDIPPHYIETIPEGIQGAKVVDRMFEEALEIFYARGDEMLRRWRQ